MFHPQPLAMLLSLLALTTTAWMVARRDYRLRLWAALALSLAGAQLVRSVSIWVVGVVLVTLVAAAIAQREHRRRIVTALAACALAIVLLPLPWYLHNQSTGGNAVFGRGMSVLSLDSPWPAEFYVDPGLPDVITHPQRAELGVGLVPILYAETWGDFFGIWSWGTARHELTSAVDRRLALQSIVGLPLTALALAGWFAFAALTASRWREAPERLVVALVPLVGLAAVVYYATRSYRPDGDTVKALFLLPAVPFWALSFGFAVDVLVERSRRRRPRRARVPRPLPARLALLRHLRVRLVSEWRFLRAGLVAVGVLVVAALVGWAVQTARYEDPGFRELRRCLVEEKGARVSETRDPIARSAELGALDTVIETNPVTVAVADDEREAAAARPRATELSRGDLGPRLELRGRTVYLWQRPPSPTQRQALFDCTY